MKDYDLLKTLIEENITPNERKKFIQALDRLSGNGSFKENFEKLSDLIDTMAWQADDNESFYSQGDEQLESYWDSIKEQLDHMTYNELVDIYDALDKIEQRENELEDEREGLL